MCIAGMCHGTLSPLLATFEGKKPHPGKNRHNTGNLLRLQGSVQSIVADNVAATKPSLRGCENPIASVAPPPMSAARTRHRQPAAGPLFPGIPYKRPRFSRLF